MVVCDSRALRPGKRAETIAYPGQKKTARNAMPHLSGPAQSISERRRAATTRRQTMIRSNGLPGPMIIFPDLAATRTSPSFSH